MQTEENIITKSRNSTERFKNDGTKNFGVKGQRAVDVYGCLSCLLIRVSSNLFDAFMLLFLKDGKVSKAPSNAKV